MLQGTLSYNDEHVGWVRYRVFANDSFDDTKLYIINDDMSDFERYRNATLVLDKGVETFFTQQGKSFTEEEKARRLEELSTYKSARFYDNPFHVVFNQWEKKEGGDSKTRRLDIKKTNKYKTNITNHLFCARVAAIIRYMQIQGQSNYNQGLDLNANPEDHFKTTRQVNIPNLGTITYEMGLIKSLSFTSPYVSMELEEVADNIFDIGIFKELKEKDKYGKILSYTPVVNIGFKLSSDLLGFQYVPEIVKQPTNVFGMYETIEEVIAAHPEKNTAWILGRKYNIVTDETLEATLEKYRNYDGLISFDTETTGLRINFKSRTGEADQLVGVVLSMRPGEGDYFPLQHKRFKNLCGGDHAYFMERYMRPILEGKRLIGHNIKFDWKVAYIYDINANFVYDTMLAFGVTKRYEMESFELSLKALVKNIFGLDMFELSDFVLSADFSKSGVTFADLPYELVRRYAPADGDMTLTLFQFIEKEEILTKYNAHRIFEIEVTFAKALAYSEFFGYHVDTEKIPVMRERIMNAMEQYKAEMFSYAGREFNPNSSVQLAKIMFDDLGIEVIGEKRSTNKEVLTTLSRITDADGNPKYPFVTALKSYRDNEGIHKNFIKKLHLVSTPDGFIFAEMQQLGTDTGRISVKEPNYQSYNDIVKQYIVPRKGFIHFDCDFSQIEYRVLASLAKQENLMKEFDDPDLDYHTYQASRMFNIPYSLVTKSLRSQSKGINFGLPYGMGDESLGFRIFGARTPENTAKAAALRRKFFEGQERIEQFFTRVRNEGVQNGFTSTHWGRRRYYHRGVYSVSEIRRQAGNHVIQGTAADIYKIAVVRMFNRIVKEGWLGKVLLNAFVHDELLMEVHKTINLNYFFKAWREEFQLEIEGFCKLFAGAGIGYSWYEAKKQDLPPQYIDEIINAYDPDEEWDEDLDAYKKRVADGYEEYKIRRIREYITDPLNQGEVIKPVIYSLLVEMVDKAAKEFNKAEDPQNAADEFNDLIQEPLLKLKDGKVVHVCKTLQQYLKVFCEVHGVNFSTINIKSPEDVEVAPAPQVQSASADPFADEFGDEEFELEQYEMSLKDLVDLSGYHVDHNEGHIYLQDRPFWYQGQQVSLIGYLNDVERIFVPHGAYKPFVYDAATNTFVGYDIRVDSYGLSRIMACYEAANMQTRTPFSMRKVTF